MSYQTRIEPKNGYLHFTVTGHNSVENVRAYLRDIVAACKVHNTSSVLVEEHLTGPSLSTIDVFAIISEGTQSLRPHVRRVAFVDTNPEHSAQLASFAETVATNRGANMRVFTDLTKAREWIERPAAQ